VDVSTPVLGLLSVSDVVQRFKSMTTTIYRKKVAETQWPPFRFRLWQRNYHERIIRDEQELRALREYIEMNPARWLADQDNRNGM